MPAMAIGTIPNNDFASKIDVSSSMASRLLNGERLPSLDTIQRIATAYGRPLDEVVGARNAGRTKCGLYLRKLVRAAQPEE